MSEGSGISYGWNASNFVPVYQRENMRREAARAKRDEKDEALYQKYANGVITDKTLYHPIDWDKASENDREMIMAIDKSRAQFPDNWTHHIAETIQPYVQERNKLRANKNYLDQQVKTIAALEQSGHSTPELSQVKEALLSGDRSALYNYNDPYGNVQIALDKNADTYHVNVRSLTKTNIPEQIGKILNKPEYQTQIELLKPENLNKYNLPKGTQEYLQTYGMPITDADAKMVGKQIGQSVRSVESSIRDYVSQNPGEFSNLENTLRNRIEETDQTKKDYLVLSPKGRQEKLASMAAEEFASLRGVRLKPQAIAPFAPQRPNTAEREAQATEPEYDVPLKFKTADGGEATVAKVSIPLHSKTEKVLLENRGNVLNSETGTIIKNLPTTFQMQGRPTVKLLAVNAYDNGKLTGTRLQKFIIGTAIVPDEKAATDVKNELWQRRLEAEFGQKIPLNTDQIADEKTRNTIVAAKKRLEPSKSEIQSEMDRTGRKTEVSVAVPYEGNKGQFTNSKQADKIFEDYEKQNPATSKGVNSNTGQKAEKTYTVEELKAMSPAYTDEVINNAVKAGKIKLKTVQQSQPTKSPATQKTGAVQMSFSDEMSVDDRIKTIKDAFSGGDPEVYIIDDDKKNPKKFEVYLNEDVGKYKKGQKVKIYH